MRTRSVKSLANAPLMGSQVPSERVAPDYTASDGLDAAKLVRIGGTVLDPWQSDILDDWLGRTPSGKWAAPSAGGSVPRQNGKSLLIQARSEAGMLLYNEQVVYTAHLQKTATETFEEMRDFFEGPKLRRHVAEIKTAIGREQIILKSGARIKFLARTRNGGRGQHGDLLIFDEAQELDETQQASFLPAISASLNPQTLYLGTPPDENADGTVFRRIRTGALDGSAKRTAWFAQKWNDSNEAACLIDLTTREKLEFVKGDQISVNVEADAASYHWLRSKPEKSVMLCHNHPGQSYYSMNDIRFFLIEESVGALSIVTNQGKVWSISKTDKFERDTAISGLAKFYVECGKDADETIDKFLKSGYTYGIRRD